MGIGIFNVYDYYEKNYWKPKREADARIEQLMKKRWNEPTDSERERLKHDPEYSEFEFLVLVVIKTFMYFCVQTN